MKALVISSSPFLNCRLGKITSDLLKYFKLNNISVSAAVWHHDVNYFMPADDGKFYYDIDGENICEIMPIPYPLNFNNIKQKSTIALYEIINKIKPDIVISVSDCDEIDFICAVKQILDFKWLGILTVDNFPINEKNLDYIGLMDSVVVTNSQSKKNIIEKIPGCNPDFYSYGYDDKIFKYNENIHDNFTVLNVSKNAQIYNIGAFIEAFAKFSKTKNDVICRMHYNINDPGEYDVDLLVSRYKIQDKIIFEDRYISIKDGLTASEMADFFNDGDVLVDCSVGSATSMGIMEAVACGCVPLVNYCGSNMDLLLNNVLNSQNIIDSLDYIGKNEEVLKISNPDNIVDKLNELYSLWKVDRCLFNNIKNKYSVEIKRYNNREFLNKIKEKMFSVIKDDSKVICIDEF